MRMVTVSSFRFRAEARRRATWLAATALLLVWPAAAQAQLGRQLETGLLSWTPGVALRDVGTDSNIYLEPGNGRADRTMIFTPTVNLKLNTRRLQLQGDGIVDFVYFERFAEERSVNRKVNGRLQFDVGRFSPYVTGMDERARERQPNQGDLRLLRDGRGYGAGVALGLTAKGTLELGFGRARSAYDSGQTFRDIDLARSLTRRTETLTGGFRYALTGLTTFALDAARNQDFYVFDSNRDTDDRRFSGTLFFAPDAVIRGRLLVGYHRLRTRTPLAIPFRGVMADVNVGYTLKESSRFTFRYNRDTNASFDSPYNLQTSYGVDLIQDIAGPLKATAGVSRQIIRHSENLFVSQLRRNERYDSYAVGLALNWSTSIKSTLAYDVNRRRSSVVAENYLRTRLLASVSLVL
ncbi:MAG: hypothetical protein Q7J25_00970 [Vicinamibacterales bacterium]|nr:hypothetical protein [Vicinamibacterales bacterium]